jgi:DNA-binding MarR family transcriptional regulator
MVDELDRLGYVTRESDPADGRRRLVRLTPAGADCLAKSAEIFEELIAEWRDGGADVDALVAALRSLEALYGGPAGLRPIW